MRKDGFEYNIDFTAFIDLYSELSSRYKTGEIFDERFEMDYLSNYCWIGKFIQIWRRRDLVQMPGETMNRAIEELSSMEKRLNS